MRTVLYTTTILFLGAAAWPLAAQEGLVGHWRFDKAGATAQDLSGKGHVASVTGGQVVTENGATFLRMDGRAGVHVPSAPDLNLKRGFSIEARVRPVDMTDGRTIVFKNDEYMLRVDWPIETNQLSFFVHAGDAWEPRVSSPKPIENVWLHIVAIWDGTQTLLWVNGLPHQMTRHGDAPPATNNPLEIGSSVGFGAGFVGDIEYVKLYSRALSSGEVIKAAYRFGENAAVTPVAESAFDFRGNARAWVGREGAEVSPAPEGLLVKAVTSGALAVHDHLDLDITKRDYLTVRMAVDKGTRGTLVFATTKGAARVPFQTVADGLMHTYVLEPWQHVGWGGKLLALGVAPAEVDGATARIQYVRVTDQVSGEGDVRLLSLYPESVLPRANRPEQIVARLTNAGGPAANVKVALRAPRGVALVGSAEKIIPLLGYQEIKQVTWTVRASSAVSGRFAAEVTGAGITNASLRGDIAFQPELKIARASYVPEPVPVDTGKYMVLTHYCPLWKHGTHTGWKAIEPYPERKPVMGWYNEGTPEVADWHIKQWLEHGIQGVVYCWYRSNLNGPVQQSLGHAIHDGLLKARYLPKIKFAIMWENGCGKGVGSAQDLMDNVFPFWLENYLANPSYLKIDGKPVLYIWVPGNVTRDLGDSETVRKTFDAMRAKCREKGLGGLYIVGCVGGADKAMLERMATEGWDASSAYGNNWYPPKGTKTVGNFTCAPVEGFADQQETIWKSKTQWNILPDITAAMMGWDSRPWNETPFYWSDNTPAKFRDLCQRAKAVMDAKPTDGPGKKTVIFCCWNEFGEGHYIEPTRGYGYAYIDAIRDTFGTAPAKHTDLAPEDVGLGPYDSWYQKARAAAPVSELAQVTSWAGESLAAWTGFMGLDKFEFSKTGLRGVSNSSDPALSAPPLKLRANQFSKVVVNMRVSKPGDAQLFWSTTSVPGASEAASLHAVTVADGQFHRYVLEVGKSEYWGGCVTSLRLDPASEAGVTIEIESVELQ
jgi:hypothetical protein